jgi:transcription-repair coupling factor (superfamily II helicase)
MHDLEIRGAGEVLGESQSGAMQEVGFGLYSDMLNLAVRSLKEGVEPDLDNVGTKVPEINLHAPALLPQDYCGDVHERLILYKRLANCQDPEQLTLLREELVDRFGKLPDAALVLVEVHRLRLLAQTIGLTKIDATSEQITLQFSTRPLTEPEAILRFAQGRKDTTFAGQDRLRIRLGDPDVQSRARKLRDILVALQPGQTPILPRPTEAAGQGSAQARFNQASRRPGGARR